MAVKSNAIAGAKVIEEEAQKQVKQQAKQRFNESIKKYRADIEAVQNKIKLLEKEIATKSDGLDGYRHIIIAGEQLKIVAYFCNMNQESVDIMKIKNENYLNDARKALYQVLIRIEDVVTNYIDVPPSELEERLELIAKMNPARKYNLINSIGYHIQLVVENFGDNSKWKWSFVEIEGRYATVAKNLIDYRQAVANNDPRKPYYVENINLMRMVKELLERASRRYREKYEQTSKEAEDGKKSIAYLSALRRIAVLTGDAAESERLKRIIEVTTKHVEASLQKKKAEKKGGGKK
jgi:hypothetical protein